MREIKFRAWNKEKEIMVYENEDDSEEYWDGVLSSDVEMVNSTFRYGPLSEYIWMQYTGLKDKNDREIYEKDIAEESYINPMTGKKVIDRYVIEWESGILKMKHIDNPKGADRYLWMRFNEVEVIGNVYQNPELLGAVE